VLALLLAGGAWTLLKQHTEAPSRRSLELAVNLVQTFVDAEYVSTTEHLSFGSPRGQRQTVEADIHDFSGAQGFLSRPSGDPPFAWLVGSAPSFDLDVLVPTARRLGLRLQGFDDRRQVVTVLMNGHELGQAVLPKTGRPTMKHFDVPASVQVRGSNTVQLLMAETVTRQLIDEPVPLPLSGAILGCHFVLPGQSDQAPPSLANSRQIGVESRLREGRETRIVVLPAEVTGRVGLRLAEDRRVVLRFTVERIDVPLEVSLLEDSGQRTVLSSLDVHDMVPREVRKDLGPWAGQSIRLDFWAGEGRGQVELSTLGLLMIGDDRSVDVESTALDVPAADQRLVQAARPDGEPWSFLVVVLDAFARERSSAFGAEPPTTPILEQLVTRGFTWDRATAPASYTLASVGSLLTGQHPLTHGVLAGSRPSGIERLHDEAPLLARTLRDAGWRTGAWLTNPNTSRRHGFSTGFDVWDELHEDDALWLPGVDGAQLPPRLAAFLDDVGDDPFFAYVHVFEPHAPWVADAALIEQFVSPYGGSAAGTREWIDHFRTSEVPMSEADWRHLEQLYDARLAQADETLGALLQELDSSGRARDTIVVVTSDHGEAFGEHGLLEHSDHVYSEQVDVPLVIVVPSESKLQLGDSVTLMDVAPTLLGLAGVGVPEQMDGVDLLSGASLGDRPQLARSFGDEPQLSWTRWPLRLVVNVATRRRELFDLSKDPGELNNLARKRPATFAWLYRELMRAVSNGVEGRRSIAALAESDEEIVDKLQELGYVGMSDDIENDVVDPAIAVLRGMLLRP